MKKILLLAGAFLLVGAAQSPAAGRFNYKVIAQNGQAGLTGIKTPPSLNDNGRAAFIGLVSGGEGVFVTTDPGVVNLAPGYASRTFTSPQINNSGAVLTRDSFGGTFRIQFWNPCCVDTPNAIDSTDGVQKSYCTGGNNAGMLCQTKFDCYDTYSGTVYYWECANPTASKYISLLFPTLNNSNEVAYIGSITATITNALASRGPFGAFDWALPTANKTMRQPMIADNGNIVALAGNTGTSPIWLVHRYLTNQAVVASTASGFSTLGQLPGINDAGTAVAFYGNLMDTNWAAQYGTTTGPGVFLWFVDNQQIIRVAGTTNTAATNTSIVASFADERVNVNSSGHVIFMGTTLAGQRTLFHAKVDLPAHTLADSGVEEVLKAGDLIDGLAGTVTDIGIWDSINNRNSVGDIACRVVMSDTRQAVILVTQGCAACSCQPGQPECNLTSLDVSMGLGNPAGGGGGGALRIYSKTPSALLSSPQALTISGPSQFNRIYDTGTLRQVKGPSCLADITVLDAYRYQVRFYTDAGTQNPVTGIYTPAGSPFSTILIENPDGAASTNSLRVTHNSSEVKTFTYDPATGTWELASAFGNALRKESLQETTVGSLRTQTRTIRDASDAILSQVVSVFQTFAWGEELAQTIEGVTPNTRTTTYNFYTNTPGDGLAYSQLRSVLDSSGHWQFYKEYGSRGLLKSVSQFRSNPYTETSTWPDPDNRSSEIAYDGNIETHTEYLAGHPISRRWHNPMLGGETWDIVATRPAVTNWDDPSNLITRSYPYQNTDTNGASAGRTAHVINPDGTLTLYSYFSQIIPDPGYTGGGIPPQIQVERTISMSGQPDSLFQSVLSGRTTDDIQDTFGNLVSRAEYDTATKALISSEIVTTRDTFGRPTRIQYLDGTYITRTYDCCGLSQETDREGITTTYNTDHTVLVDLVSGGGPETYYGSSVTRAGISTHTLTDALGRSFKTILQGTNGVLIVQDERHYNVLGDLDWSKDAMGRTNTYSQINSGGFTIRTTTFPDGSHSIESTYQDGTAYETKGNAVQGLRYAYDVVQDNGIYVQTTTQTRLENDGSVSPEYTTTYTDFAGRAYKTETPWPDGPTNAVSLRSYNGLGQLAKSTDADGVATLYTYNGRGELETTAVDVANPGVIDFGGADRITRTTNVWENSSLRGTVVHKTVTEIWETNGSPQSTALQITETSADGIQTWSTQYGLTTTNITAIDRANQRRTVTSKNPDGTSTVTVFEQGQQKSVTRLDRNGARVTQTIFAYDGFGRLQTQTDARNGPTTYSYYDDGQIHAVTTPDPDTSASGPGLDPQTNSYAYYRDPVNGIKTVTTLPDGGVVTQEFFPSGQLKRTWGTRTYPVEYTYDRAGRMETLITWQQFNFGTGTGISGSATTRWNYNARGLLANKRYVDNKGPTYTYTAGGKLKTRLWARGVLTTYGYDAKTGDLLTTAYSDATPAVTNTYARSGQLQSVADASGLRTFGYHHTQTATEAYAAGMFAGFTLVRDYDGLDRQAALSVPSPTGQVYHVTYGYDAASHLDAVTSGVDVATYAYHPDSDLVHTLTQAHSSAVRLTTTKLYDNLGRLQSITSVPSADSPISFAYQYNDANQRTRATLANGEYWTYGYDSLGQVTNGVKRFPNSAPIPGYNFGYQFDHIGNRMLAIRDNQSDAYTNNLLNQIQSVNYAPWLHVLGQMNSNATITLNGQSPVRSNGYFYAQLSATSNWNSVSIQARAAGGATNGADALAEETGHLFQTTSLPVFQYDEDGNLKSDNRWSYTWDAENRIYAIETLSNLVASGVPRVRLDFGYDSQNRRFKKAESNITVLPPNLSLVSETRFIYDNWNIILEVPNETIRPNALVHGLDVFNSLQNDGSAGTLLATFADNTRSEVSFYDGTGNSVGTISALTGSTSTSRDYSPFGRTLRATGRSLSAQGFGYASKAIDLSTGLLYYGHRFYDPANGRWLTKDFIGEAGGDNLYAFVGNNSLNVTDVRGMYGRDVHGFFTYFAALAAGAEPADAHTLAEYSFAPDAVRELNAIPNGANLLTSPDDMASVARQQLLHSLSGESAFLVQSELEAVLSSPDLLSDSQLEQFGFYTHAYQDAYSHTRININPLNFMKALFGGQFSRGTRLYIGPFGHVFNGNFPDNVGQSKDLFKSMAIQYFDIAKKRFGKPKMSQFEFYLFVDAIADVSDGQREQFVRYIAGCQSDSSKPNEYFERLLKRSGLKRTGLDPNFADFSLPTDQEYKDRELFEEAVFGIIRRAH